MVKKLVHQFLKCIAFPNIIIICESHFIFTILPLHQKFQTITKKKNYLHTYRKVRVN